MPNVTSLEVSFGRTIQPQPYHSVSASVRLTVAFREDETPRPADEEIADAMARAIRHVEQTLGMAPTQREVAVVETKGMGAEAPAAKITGKRPVEPTKPAPKAAKEPAKPEPVEEDAEAPAPTYEDAYAAIQQAVARLGKVMDSAAAAEEVKRVRNAYLPDGLPLPRQTYRSIPEHSLGDFIHDINRLGR